MKYEDAEEYTQALGQVVAGGWRQIALGKRLGVPKALDLSVQEWVDQRLGGYIRMSIEERREAVAELTEEGMSTRETAEVLGVSQRTAANDLRAEQNYSDRELGHMPDEEVDGDSEQNYSAEILPEGQEHADEAAKEFDRNNSEPEPIDAMGALALGEVRETEKRKAEAKTREPAPVEEPVPPPEGKYSCVVIDPPWPMRKIERDERPNQGATLDYAIQSLDDIADEKWVPVRTLAAEDCHIYLWVTQRYLPAGLELLEGWGFNYQCVMTWRKNVGITPYSWMYDTEHVLFGTRGNLKLQRLGLRLSFEAPTQGHSVKPDVFYERVAEASPGPRIDMFPGVEHDGFEPWGLEASHRAV